MDELDIEGRPQTELLHTSFIIARQFRFDFFFFGALSTVTRPCAGKKIAPRRASAISGWVIA